MMTKEEIIQDLFNKMWRGLSAQNWIPTYKNGACFYRMPDGRKCAVGHCIPDDMYSEDMEGLSVYQIDILDELGWSKWPKVIKFLKDVQKCHDYAAQTGQMKASLKLFAADYGLTIPDAEAAE